MSSQTLAGDQQAGSDVGSMQMDYALQVGQDPHMSLALHRRVVTLNHAVKAMNDGMEQLFVHVQVEAANHLSSSKDCGVRADQQDDAGQLSTAGRSDLKNVPNFEPDVTHKVVNQSISQSAAWARSVLSRLDVISSRKSGPETGEES